MMLAVGGCGRKHRVYSTNNCLRMNGSDPESQKAYSTATESVPESWPYSVQEVPSRENSAWIEPITPKTFCSDDLVAEAISSVREFQKTPEVAQHHPEPVQPPVTLMTHLPSSTTLISQSPSTGAIASRPTSTEMVAFLEGRTDSAIGAPEVAHYPAKPIQPPVVVKTHSPSSTTMITESPTTRVIGNRPTSTEMVAFLKDSTGLAVLEAKEEKPPCDVSTTRSMRHPRKAPGMVPNTIKTVDPMANGQLSLSVTTFNGTLPLEVSLRKPTDAEMSAFHRRQKKSSNPH